MFKYKSAMCLWNVDKPVGIRTVQNFRPASLNFPI